MTQTENTSRFNPNEHLLQLKSKAGSQDYLPVQWRLVWFRSVCPQGTIDTEEVFVDLDREVEAEAYVWNAEKRRSEKVIKQAKGYARFRAVVTDGKGGRATATGSEAAVDFPDYIEKAETKAVGRALAALGYGTQFAPEFGESHRLVDAPVDFGTGEMSNDPEPTTTPRAETPASAGNSQTPPAPRNLRPAASAKPAPQQSEQAQPVATPQQKASIRKLCEHVQMSVPKDLDTAMTYVEAKALIAELTAEYKNQRNESQGRPAQPAPAPAPTNGGQSKALLDMLNRAKKRVESLDMVWQSAKTDAGLGQVQDADLGPKQIAAINAVVDQYEQRASSKAS